MALAVLPLNWGLCLSQRWWWRSTHAGSVGMGTALSGLPLVRSRV